MTSEIDERCPICNAFLYCHAELPCPHELAGSEAKLAEFKRLSADRKSHPEAVQAAWEAFIQAVEFEAARKEMKDYTDNYQESGETDR